jgi:hypothetical protein
MAPTNYHFPGMDDFRRYQSGEMSLQEQHKLEVLMLEDPFVAQAFEGFLASQQAYSNHSDIGSELRDRLANRLERKAGRRSAFWPYASAASALICLGLYWVIFLNKNQAPPVEIARQSAMEEIPQIKAAEPANSAPRAPASVTAIAKAPKPAQPASKFKPATLSAPKKAAQALFDSGNERLAAAETAAAASAVPIVSGRTQPEDSESQAFDFKPLKASTGKQGATGLRRSEAVIQLSEVAVSHSNIQRKQTPVSAPAAAAFLPAQPAEGWTAYQSYIEKNSLSELEGKVTVSFVVAQDGSLSGFSAHGIQPLHQQAIQLVRQGPVWTAARSNGTPISMLTRLEIHFRIKQ